MKHLLRWMAFAGVFLAGPAAAAGFSANVGAASEYLFRGMPMSDGPALQGGLDFTGHGGGYAGIWATNVLYDGESGAELDLYGSVPLKAFGLDLELGAVVYLFSETGDRGAAAQERVDYFELLLGGQFGPVSGRVFYSPDYFNSGSESVYLTISSSISLTAGTHLFGQFGGLDWKGIDRYMDYSAGLKSVTPSGLTFSLGAHGTTRRTVSSPAAGPTFPATAGGGDDVRIVVSVKQVFDL
jgi:uncharacterized protein (TIGR02001 family)